MLDFNALRPNHKAGLVLTISQLLEGGDGRQRHEKAAYRRRIICAWGETNNFVARMRCHSVLQAASPHNGGADSSLR